MQLILVRGSGFISRLIRFAQARRGYADYADITHVAALLSDGTTVIQARFKGVEMTTLATCTDPHDLIPLHLSSEDETEAVAFLRSRIGDRYSLVDIASIVLMLVTSGKIGLLADDADICSSLVGEALERAGVIWPCDPSRLMPAGVARWAASASVPR